MDKKAAAAAAAAAKSLQTRSVRDIDLPDSPEATERFGDKLRKRSKDDSDDEEGNIIKFKNGNFFWLCAHLRPSLADDDIRKRSRNSGARAVTRDANNEFGKGEGGDADDSAVEEDDRIPISTLDLGGRDFYQTPTTNTLEAPPPLLHKRYQVEFGGKERNKAF